MDHKLLTFLPKMYFPSRMFTGVKSMTFFKTIAEAKKVFIISETCLSKCKDLVDPIVEGSKVVTHTGEPRREDIEKFRKECEGFEYIVAIGGGSIIDLAKIVKMKLGVPLVAVPTTIGSGSEVSQFSPVVNDEKGCKEVEAGSDLLPEVVLLDPRFYQTLPRETVVFQALDGLAHATEALVSKMANTTSDYFARMAIDSLYRLLSEAVTKEEFDVVFLEEIKLATTMAGLAQSSAATGLVHSFAHYFGAKNSIPHAVVVAMFFLPVVKLNAANSDKYAKMDVLGNLSSKNFVEKFEQLYQKLDLDFPSIELTDDIEVTATAIKRDICTMSNPCSPQVEDIVAILNTFV